MKQLPLIADVVALAAGRAVLSARAVYEIEGGVPNEFRMLRAGLNQTEKGDFTFDDQAARDCMDFFSAKGVELAFDYEHMSLASPPVVAPAAGWWKPEIRNGELWATNIRWTEKAAAMLAQREYRYFSPAFEFDKETGRVTRIVNCALTNTPAMDRIEPLMAASSNNTNPETQTMNLEQLQAQIAKLTAENEALRAQLATLAASKDDEEMCSAVALKGDAGRVALKGRVVELGQVSAKLRALTGAESDAAALGAVEAWKAGAAETAQLKAEKAEVETAALRAEFDGVIEQAVKDGKLPPAADHAVRKTAVEGALAFGAGKPSKNGVAWLKAHVGALSVLAPSSSAGAPRLPEALPVGQEKVLETMGLDKGKFARFTTEGPSALRK